MIEIIPAIDIMDGKCVRLRQGDFATQTIYSSEPSDIAKRFEELGIRRLHIVDLDGARSGQLINLSVLEAIASKTSLSIDFGGGIKNEIDVRSVFDAGAKFANIGSIAVKEPDTVKRWITEFGSDRIILGADVLDDYVYINGWQTNSSLKLIEFLKMYLELGISNVFVTDISKDGLLNGPSIDLYRKIINSFGNINLIASGGVAGVKDIHELNKIGCSGVIVGKAIYEGKITDKQLQELIKLNVS